jgi:hypothetical protein
MLDAAHASAWHWAKVGSELNRMRATLLLAEVHALLGFGHSAMTYAEQMRTYFLGVQSPASEVAFVHVVHAHAASAARETEKHRASYGQALAPSKQFRTRKRSESWPARSGTCPNREAVASLQEDHGRDACAAYHGC